MTKKQQFADEFRKEAQSHRCGGPLGPFSTQPL